MPVPNFETTRSRAELVARALPARRATTRALGLRRCPGRWRRTAAFVVACAVLASLAAGQAEAVPFYVHDVREVCQFPRANNDGNILGHDSGSSVRYHDKTYWFFADTLYDANGNGALDPSGDGFIGQGTVATTDDTDASNCLDMEYSGVARKLFPDSEKHADERLLWPIGSIVANDRIYIYSSAKKNTSACESGPLIGQVCNPASTSACSNVQTACVDRYQTFLAKLDTETLEAARLTTEWPTGQVPSFLFPFKFNEATGCGVVTWVYLVGTKTVPAPPFRLTYYYLARVAQAAIEDPSKYQFYDAVADAWVKGVPTAATPIFEEYFGGQPSVAYNTYLGRWMLTYAGGIGSQVLARTALVAGKTTAGLVGGWSEPVTIFDCPGGTFGCYFPFQHPEYGDGSTLYLTTSRNTPVEGKCTTNTDCECKRAPLPNFSIGSVCVGGFCTTPGESRKYRMRLREVRIGTAQPPAGRQLVDAARDFTPNPRCDKDDFPVSQPHDGWSYYRANGNTLTALNFTYANNWSGLETVGVLPAPNIEEDVMRPGNNSDALRVWSATRAGTVRVSGEVRTKYNCSFDGVRVDWVRIRSGVVTSLENATLSSINRGKVYDYTWTVQANDRIGFKVSANGTLATCDDVDFAPTITFTPTP